MSLRKFKLGAEWSEWGRLSVAHLGGQRWLFAIAISGEHDGALWCSVMFWNDGQTVGLNFSHEAMMALGAFAVVAELYADSTQYAVAK